MELALHIIGALIAFAAVYIVDGVVHLARESSRKDRVNEEIASHFKMSVEAYRRRDNDPDFMCEVLAYLAEKYSTERFANRLSNLIGHLYVFSTWVILGGIIWFFGYFTYEAVSSGDVNDAELLWLSPLFALCGIAFRLISNFLCRLITGRNLGEAKVWKKGEPALWDRIEQLREEQAEEDRWLEDFERVP